MMPLRALPRPHLDANIPAGGAAHSLGVRVSRRPMLQSALRAELRRARNAEAAWNNKPESTNEPTCRPVNQLSPAHFQSALQFCSRCERRWHNPAASRTQGAAKDTGTRAAAHVRRRCHFLTHARPPARAKQTHTKPE